MTTKQDKFDEHKLPPVSGMGVAVESVSDAQRALDALERLYNEALSARDGYLLPDEYETIRAAITAAMNNGVPDGYALVPIEPTVEMEVAGCALGNFVGVDDVYRAMIAAAPQSPQIRDGWLPIETAPKDGSWLLLGYFNCLGNWRTVRGQWFSVELIAETWENIDGYIERYEGWYETAENAEDIPNVWRVDPTHWMPLPKAPEVKNEN